VHLPWALSASVSIQISAQLLYRFHDLVPHILLQAALLDTLGELAEFPGQGWPDLSLLAISKSTQGFSELVLA